MAPSFGLLALLLGCGSALSSAIDEFEGGRLPEAARRFRSLETQQPAFARDDRLRYALYRGLTDLALGDAVSAERWLGEVKRTVDGEPFALNDSERGRLLAAWRSMGHMPGE